MIVERLPVYVITGFLGSGKTTLLQYLLNSPSFSDTAVIINEFGEAGLDHEMIDSVEESTVVLKGGCICCGVREDLASTVRHLVELRRSCAVTKFRRLVIETSGLADPVPVIFTLINDSRITEVFDFQGIVATVDSQNGASTLDKYDENRRQLLYASRAVLTKTDLVDNKTCQNVEEKIRAINPWISVMRSDGLKLSADSVFGGMSYGANNDGEATTWLGSLPASSDAAHSHQYRSLAWTFDTQIDWTAFGIWLTMLLHTHGDRILRVKGILNVEGVDSPIAVHGVQHIVHPPVHLDARSDTRQPSRLVVIVKDIDPAIIEQSFSVFATGEFRSTANLHKSELSMGSGRTIASRPVRRPSAPIWMKG